MTTSATWRTEKWAKDVPGPVMSETLDNIQTDDKKVPTLPEAVKEAHYVLSLYREGGTQAQGELAGEYGPEAKRGASAEVRKLNKFILKYEA
jgi:hypothetical protein